MRRDIAEFVARCLNCQQVKFEHRKPGGEMQRMPILEWKWESIAMDFVVGLPVVPDGYDSIFVVVDHLTKIAHFILVKVTHNARDLAQIFISQIVRLHGTPLTIIYDRGTQFTSRFWSTI